MATYAQDAIALMNLAMTHPHIVEEHHRSDAQLKSIHVAENLLEEFIQTTDQMNPVPAGNPTAGNLGFWQNLYGADAFGAILGGLLLYLIIFRYVIACLVSSCNSPTAFTYYPLLTSLSSFFFCYK